MRTFVLCTVGLAACSATKRSPTVYRQDTQAVLETRRAQIATCYDTALESDPKVSGLVAVRFVVEKKTGAFIKATVDPARTNANEALSLCVLAAVRGLALNPPDANEGHATFVYDFQPAPVTGS